MSKDHPATAQPGTDAHRCWRAALALLKADFRRRLELEGQPVTLLSALGLAMKPGGLSVACYRIGTWLHQNHHPILSRILDLSHFYTGIELQIGSRIGPGLVLRDQKGIGVHHLATIGKNCTILGRSTVTLGGLENIDPTRDRLIMGDHCIVGPGTRIVGAVTIADGTQIKPNSVVLLSSPVPGSILSGVPARRRGTVPVAGVAEWNPLTSRLRSNEVGGPFEIVTGRSPSSDIATRAAHVQ